MTHASRQVTELLPGDLPPVLNPMPTHAGEVRLLWIPLEYSRMAELFEMVVACCGFDRHEVLASGGMATARKRIQYDVGFRGSREVALDLKWLPAVYDGIDGMVVGCRVECVSSRSSMVFDEAWTEQVKQALMDVALNYQYRQRHLAPPRNPVLAPGAPLTRYYQGQPLDYSGCAKPEQLSMLVPEADSRNILPLGCYAFSTEEETTYGPRLYMDAEQAFRGTLICAPQGAGKTELMLSWARAIHAAGYSMLLIDVKGNMLEKLDRMGVKRNRFHLSADKKVPSARVNFVADLDLNPEDGSSCFRELAAAILPKEEGQEKEGRLYKLWVSWLTAMIVLVKLQDYHYRKETDREADLSDVYALALDEEALKRCINRLIYAELHPPPRKAVFTPGVGHWAKEVALLLDRVIKFPGEGHIPAFRGQRSERYMYRELTEHIVEALRPFSPDEPLYRKVSGFPARGNDRFSLKALNGPDPVTVVVSIPGKADRDADTILAMVNVILGNLIGERFRMSDKRPLLLLLDETSRIRNFKIDDVITFVREAAVGYVVAYQAIDQIGDDKAIHKVLENVGTQIYLRELTNNTAKFFINQLRNRARPDFSMTTTKGQQTVEEHNKDIDFFSRAELATLPAGERPAMVYMNYHSVRRLPPFLVDLERRFLDTVTQQGDPLRAERR